MNRETWLNDLATLMAPRFEELGKPLPAFRVSIGFTGAPKTANAIGVCYSAKASADGRHEIFIVPQKADPLEVAAILAHELTHAAVGLKCGHKGPFATVALELGFQRPLTKWRGPTDALRDWLQPLLDQLPALPHAALRDHAEPSNEAAEGDDEPEEPSNSNEKKKQSTRMLKATCQAIAPAGGDGNGPGQPCGYTIRISKKWAKEMGACCPVHGGMEVEGVDDEGGEDDADQ